MVDIETEIVKHFFDFSLEKEVNSLGVYLKILADIGQRQRHQKPIDQFLQSFAFHARNRERRPKAVAIAHESCPKSGEGA